MLIVCMTVTLTLTDVNNGSSNSSNTKKLRRAAIRLPFIDHTTNDTNNDNALLLKAASSHVRHRLYVQLTSNDWSR
jgi:hypothetical protein